MKKIILTISLLTASMFAIAQDDYVDKTSNTANRQNIYSKENRVGIRTNQPLGNLHVVSNSWHNNSSQITGIRLDGLWGAYMLMDGDDIDVYGANMFLQDYSNKHIQMVGGGGNVGIACNATNIPSGYRLGVGGGIITEKIKVKTLPWADYVFEQNYKLLTLAEVNDFIIKNKHLPEIPSAKEVEADNGIDLGRLNVLLLQKIEELTLYTIQQQNDINKLEVELNKNQTQYENLIRLLLELKKEINK